jgi:hypothetical protein
MGVVLVGITQHRVVKTLKKNDTPSNQLKCSRVISNVGVKILITLRNFAATSARLLNTVNTGWRTKNINLCIWLNVRKRKLKRKSLLLGMCIRFVRQCGVAHFHLLVGLYVKMK